MAWSYPLKNARFSWQWLRPMLLASVAVHALVLLIPMGGAEKPAEQPAAKPPEEEAIKLTQLAPQNKTTATPTPKAATPPKPQTPTPPRLTVPPRPAPAIAAPPAPRPAAPPPVAVQPSSQATPASEPEQPAQATEDPLALLVSRYSPSQPGVVGAFPSLAQFQQAIRNSPNDVASVGSWFETELGKLGAKGFSFQKVSGDPTLTVYAIQGGTSPQYLTLFSNNQGAGTNILLANTQLKPENLQGGSIEVETAEQNQFFADLGLPQGGIVDPQSLQNPQSFYQEFTGPTYAAGIRDSVLLTNLPASGALGYIQESLVGYTIAPASSTYGGGEIYTITRDDIPSVTGCLSIVQAGADSTAVFVWNACPQ
ncbi:MAG: hypothetical protein MUF49_22005 [Oculatellaceae cyanobacterium Prado106]|jgi:hypothetical protein|nr:hypothetical protein [Oculatellaceae cyanobacterium Prado106]